MAFPIMIFVLIRQIYVNLFGVNKDILSALLVASLTGLSVLAFSKRLRAQRSDLLLVDAITLAQFFLAAIVIVGYMGASLIHTAEVASSLYYYCLAPFLIYSGYFLCRFRKTTLQAALIAAGLAYLVTFWAALYQVLEVNFWLFQSDWLLERNFLGIGRATGMYGTQIDYGCLSFMTFCVAYYINIRRHNWFAKLIALTAVLGAISSMSRVWMAGILGVFVIDFIFRQSWKHRVAIALAIAVLTLVLHPIASELGITSIVASEDEDTQTSNYNRIEYFSQLQQWLLHDYPLVGTGPGTQNGPDTEGQKFVGDFLWLGYMVDFGALTGVVLVLLRIVLLIYLAARSYRSHVNPSLRWVTSALCISFIFASIVDSAYAHPVTISVFYIIAGVFLYCDQPNGPARSDSRESSRALSRPSMACHDPI
ncbi:MAG: hypothetical protein ABSD67_22850 [Terracidiphilus sp.]